MYGVLRTYVSPSVRCEPGNDDVIQLPYCLLTMAGSWSTHDHRCHKAKKRFTANIHIFPI